jgi:PGF-CTERM protein
MYELNFGGKRMTKRLTIALVALAMFVLVAVMPASAAFYYVNTSVINQGATVYIGEQGLNIQPAMDKFQTDFGYAPTQIGWWASAAQIGSTSPTVTVPLTSATDFYVSYAAFGGYYNNWYVISPVTGFADSRGGAFINVKDPQLSVDVWDFSQGSQGGISVSGKSIIQGDLLGFKIGTNMDQAINQPSKRAKDVASEVTYWADIKVKTDAGNTLTALYNGFGTTTALTKQTIDSPSWTWAWWDTAALDSGGQTAYPAGTYTVTVQSMLNNMYDNYQQGGAAYSGKTVSDAKTVTLASNTVKITANKDSVVRSKPFSVTVTGRPNTVYHVWVKSTSTLTGGFDNQPPMIAQFQAGVTQDRFTGTVAAIGSDPQLTLYTSGNVGNAGGYLFQNSGSTGIAGSVWYDVAHGSTNDYKFKLGNGTYLYANVSLADSGTRTVEFTTSNWTKAQKYTIHVEQNFVPGGYKSDEVDVKVEKGAVTIVAAGDQSYYLGEEIKFSGTNTETQTTYLFITGPNLPTNGAQIQNNNPRDAPVVAGDPATFQQASVLGDNTWSWKWGTSNVALDAGTYTIWAASQPSNTESKNLEKAAYGTVSIVIKKPFISATASQSTVAMGDRVYILGTAEGKPSVGVQIWILGKNYAVVKQQAVNSDSSFSYEVTRETTKNLYAGQYFVVAQHPMQNNQFDVYLDGNNVWNRMLGAAPGTKVFNLLGAGSLQGSDAAEALIQAINDPNVDDTYTKLQFLIENPVITITPVGDRHVGDKFTIVASTNLAVDDEILCQVYSSSFKPTQKSQSGEFSGATGTVKVTKGDGGLNKISFDVDASTFKPDEYIIQESAVLQSATGSALFNVLEGAAPTAVPTVVKTTAVPTVIVTTVPPTTVATPTKTPTQPGFGALVALIGLGAVAFLVVRRH